MEIYFEEIRERIIQELSHSKFCVFAAVAWMSEKFILNELVNCLKRGVQVEIVINNDEKFQNTKKYFKDFEQFGGKLLLFDTATSLMHNKFCVIDLCPVITGSFNWSYGATFHQENIIIERYNITASHQFAHQFIKLKQQSTLFSNQKTANVELAHSVKLLSVTGYSDHIDGNGIIVILQEGNRMGILELEAPFGNDISFIPNEIQGFWLSKLEVEEFDDSGKDPTEWYEFVCIDPRIVQFLRKS